MKIIEPLLDLASVSTNNAPIDALDTWAPVGRDLLNYLVKPIFDTAGDLMIIASEDGGKIYKVDLSTGIVSDVGYDIFGYIRDIKLSPDGLYFCIVWGSGGFVSFVQVSDGAEKYRINQQNALSVNYDDKLLQYSRDGASWSSDSVDCYFIAGRSIRTVSSTTWISTEIYEITDGGPYGGVLLADSYIYTAEPYSINSFGVGTFSLARLNTSGVVQASWSTVNLQYGYIRFNLIRDEIILIAADAAGFQQTTTLNKSTLATLTQPANLPTSSRQAFMGNPQTIRITADHFISRARSSSPYWNYHALSDYTKTNPLPVLPNPGEGISAATNYTVIQQNNGIALLDNLNVQITQTNPNVIAGDGYIYEDNVYEVLIDNNDQPDEGAALAIPSWINAGATNPLRLFDGKLDSLTTAPNQLIINITPLELVMGMALFSLQGETLRVTMTDSVDGVVFDTGAISMIDNSSVTDWWAFNFDPYIDASDFVSISIPPYLGATIQITIDGGSGVAVGEVVVGRVHGIGTTQFGSGVGILDFSEKEQDQFGNFNIIPRKFAKRAEYDVKVATVEVSGVQRVLSKFRATPIVWVGDVERDETVIYGFFKAFDIVLSSPSLSEVAITVEGL
tara:strand:+ start:843 stop:2702 length:1860 start_codon:yes stop_codon:yes gene_type:complete